MANKSERIEAEVLRLLREVDVNILERICGELEIDIPGDKKGNKFLVLKLIVRYLHSTELELLEDQGLSIFMRILNEYIQKNQPVDEGELNSPKTVKIEVGEPNLGNKLTEYKDKNPLINVNARREFKIYGSVGSGKDSLSYTSLSFQMGQGKRAGYSPAEIQAAVIKAMKPGSSLRNYLESREDVEDKAFIQVLRSHYKEKDSASVFHEMSNAVQSPLESELDFCLRVMSLRQRVVSLSVEEGYPFDETLVRRRFFQAIHTGLKHNNLRVHLQAILKAGEVSDEELLHEISVASSVEQEHINKVKQKASVNEVSKVESPSQSSEKTETQKINKNSTLLSEINQLSAKMNELSSVHDEIQNIKKQLANLQFQSDQVSGKNANFGSRQCRRQVFRCQQCENRKRNFCDHCFQCGESGHRKNQCTFQKNE